THVVQEDPHQKDVAVELRIKRQQAIGAIAQRNDMLQKSADVGMVVPHTGRDFAESADKLLVHQEALRQGPEVRIAEPQQSGAKLVEQLANVLLRMRQKVSENDLFRF